MLPYISYHFHASEFSYSSLLNYHLYEIMVVLVEFVFGKVYINNSLAFEQRVQVRLHWGVCMLQEKRKEGDEEGEGGG